MKSRNELAHDYLCALLANPRAYDDLEVQKATAVAFGVADAFLAACGEKPESAAKAKRRPDAVWMMDSDGNTFATPGLTWKEDVRRLLAGRDRVKLAVRVVEDSE